MKKLILVFILAVTVLQSVAACEKDVFLNALKQDLSQNSDSLRTEIMIFSPIYDQASSEMSDYIPMFNYLLDHCTEECSEGIGGHFYEMFTNYPDKHIEFEKFLGYLPNDEQQKILVNLTMFITFEFLFEYENYPIADLEGLFRSSYPFLYKHPCCIAEFRESLESSFGKRITTF